MNMLSIRQAIGRTELVLKKNSPEILLAAGIIGGVAAAVMAARATLKAGELIEQHNENVKMLEEVVKKTESGEIKEEYTADEQLRDKAIVYIQTGIKFIQLYGPAFALGTLSIGSILASHGIMEKRQVALIGAYNLLAEGYRSYRDRVVEELGEEKDLMFHRGLLEEKYSETEKYEDGTSAKVKKTAQKYDPYHKSIYAKFFDQTSPMWRTVAHDNLYFLKAQETYANQKLTRDGFLLLNDVYDSLGIPRTQAGSMVGWIKYKTDDEAKEKGVDNFIDFDIYNITNAPGRAFVNGYENAILLDFNVQGVVFDLLERV